MDKTCCGLPMEMWVEVFGIRILRCAYRDYHPAVFVNLVTGQEVGEEEATGRNYDGTPFRDCDHTECNPRGCQYRSE